MRSIQSFAKRQAVKFGGIAILDVERDVYNEREYHVWYDMALRCFPDNQIGRLSSYAGSSISEEWKYYSEFYNWIHGRFSSGKNLDKDIKIRGNKIYGPSSCVVVSSKLNKAFQLRSGHDLPHGVKARPGNKFAAVCFNEDGSTSSKNFSSTMEAHHFWQISKALHIVRVAKNHKEPEEIIALVENRSKILLDNAIKGIETKGYL